MCDIALYAFGFHINECHRTTLYAQPHTHDWRINARKEFEYSYLRAMPNQPTTNPLEESNCTKCQDVIRMICGRMNVCTCLYFTHKSKYKIVTRDSRRAGGSLGML